MDANEVHELPADGKPPDLLVVAPVRLAPHPVVALPGTTLSIEVWEVPSAQLDYGLLNGLPEARVRHAVGDIRRGSYDYPPVALLARQFDQFSHFRLARWLAGLRLTARPHINGTRAKDCLLPRLRIGRVTLPADHRHLFEFGHLNEDIELLLVAPRLHMDLDVRIRVGCDGVS